MRVGIDMKKLLLTIFMLFVFGGVANAATLYGCTSGGTFSGNIWTATTLDQALCASGTGPGTTNDLVMNAATGNITIGATTTANSLNMTGYAGTLAFGTNHNLTLAAGATLQGAFSGAGTSALIVKGGGVTLAATTTGTAPTLSITTATQSLTSGGFTCSLPLSLGYAGNITLVGNWVNTGLVTFAAATNLLKTSTETLTANGGLKMTSASGTTPTATIVLGGGTWQTNNILNNNLTLAGNITISGAVGYKTGTLTYSSGTITVANSQLVIQGTCTLNTVGMTWNEINVGSGGGTITLGSALSTTYLELAQNNTTFAGAFNITTGDLIKNNSPGITLILVSGTTLTITNMISLSAANFTATSNFSPFVLTIKSSSTPSVAYFNYTGTSANQKISGITFTDISATGATWVTSHAYAVGDLVNTGGSKYLCAIAHTSGTFATDLAAGKWTIQNTKQIFNYAGGTLSNTSGITNINANNVGGIFIQ
jgi:hypothetical protein